jgi:hypothetical protein
MDEAGKEVKVPPKKATSFIVWSGNRLECIPDSIVFLMLSPEGSLADLLVMLLWLQNIHLYGHPWLGIKMGMMK